MNHNCIFVCVFNKESYVELFFLLLESILQYGNLNHKTDILVYTSTSFMNIIKKHYLFLFNDKKIFFEINDTYDTIDKACKSRYNVFNLNSIDKYNKILYLDTDIVIIHDINKVFDVCKKDVIYVVMEGDINCSTDYWGKSLFGDEINSYPKNTYAFSSGIILFNNCKKIKRLFYKINKDMNNRNHYFNDQPFLVYNAFKYKLYDNIKLNKITTMYYEYKPNLNRDSTNTIHHFCGWPGFTEHKLIRMECFLFHLNLYRFSKTIFSYDKNLMESVTNFIQKYYDVKIIKKYKIFDLEFRRDIRKMIEKYSE